MVGSAGAGGGAVNATVWQFCANTKPATITAVDTDPTGSTLFIAGRAGDYGHFGMLSPYMNTNILQNGNVYGGSFVARATADTGVVNTSRRFLAGGFGSFTSGSYTEGTSYQCPPRAPLTTPTSERPNKFYFGGTWLWQRSPGFYYPEKYCAGVNYIPKSLTDYEVNPTWCSSSGVRGIKWTDNYMCASGGAIASDTITPRRSDDYPVGWIYQRQFPTSRSTFTFTDSRVMGVSPCWKYEGAPSPWGASQLHTYTIGRFAQNGPQRNSQPAVGHDMYQGAYYYAGTGGPHNTILTYGRYFAVSCTLNHIQSTCTSNVPAVNRGWADCHTNTGTYPGAYGTWNAHDIVGTPTNVWMVGGSPCIDPTCTNANASYARMFRLSTPGMTVQQAYSITTPTQGAIPGNRFYGLERDSSTGTLYAYNGSFLMILDSNLVIQKAYSLSGLTIGRMFVRDDYMWIMGSRVVRLPSYDSADFNGYEFSYSEPGGGTWAWTDVTSSYCRDPISILNCPTIPVALGWGGQGTQQGGAPNWEFRYVSPATPATCPGNDIQLKQFDQF